MEDKETKTINKGKLKSLIPYFLLAIGVIVVYKVITEISFLADFMGRIWSIITPFFYGFLIAYIFNVPFGGLKRLFKKSRFKFFRKIGVPLSAVLTILFFALLIFAVLNLFIPYIIRSIYFFITNLPSYYEGVLYAIDRFNNLDLFGIRISSEGIMSMLQEIFQNLNIDDLTSTMNALFGVPSAIITGIIAFISSIYIIIEKDKFKNFLRRLLAVFTSANISETVLQYASRLNANFKRYIRVQTIDGLILGTLVTIQLLIFRSPFALLLGVMLGIVNYIPYFGSIFGTIVVVIIIAFTQGLTIAAIAAVTLLITQQIDGNIIQPKLMGGSFSLSPLLVIISITVGGALAGVLGMIVAIPIVAVLKDIFDSILVHYERKKFKTAETPPDKPDESTANPV